jgi:class 3 adenylate cyclase
VRHDQPPSIDRAALGATLDALCAYPRLSRDAISRLGELIETRSAWELCRINPYDWAERHGLDPVTTLELCVHGARVGLFDLSWNTVCVFCGAVERFYETIDDVPPSHFHCTPCDADIDALLDERIEVSFSVSPAVARAAIDPFADQDSYLRWFTSPSVTPAPEARALFERYRLGFLAPAPEHAAEVAVPLAAGDVVRLVSYDRHVSATITAAEGAPARDGSCRLLPAGFAPDALTVAPGAAVVRVENRCAVPIGALVLAGDAETQQHAVETHRATLRRYLTAAMLLNTQSFRDLFRLPSRDAHLALRMRHLTVLFTDLRNSTGLYDRLGDAAAYALVRRHFAELVTATRRHHGAVVKTIGDAVMATFSTPIDGVRAALDMLRQVGALDWSRAPDREPLGLKIGLHAGPALVVNAEDRLDYFGHTVNVAARVQDLAVADRVCLTQAVLDAPGVRDVLARHAETSVTSSVAIRGVAEPITVHQVAVRAARAG